MSKHSFAHHVLEKRNIKIFCGDKQILAPLAPNKQFQQFYDSELQTTFTLHTHISITKEEIKEIKNYRDLEQLGFQISRRRPTIATFRSQKAEYYLVRISSNLPGIGYIPLNTKIQHNNVENWLMLVGPNSRPTKVFLNQSKRDYGGRDVDWYNAETASGNLMQIYESYYEQLSPYTFEEKEEKITINELPLVVTADGKLVCLPSNQNNPTIGVFGKKGKGKTVFIHGLTDRIHHKWHERCIHINDGLSFQTKSWSLPWNSNDEGDKDFLRWLSLIGETSRPLPCVYLYPTVNNMRPIDLENDVSFKISLPYRDIMQNPLLLFEGTDEALGKSEKYITDSIKDNYGKIRPDGLIYAESVDDIQRILNEKVWTEKSKEYSGVSLTDKQQEFRMPEGVRSRLFALLKDLWNSNIFDVTTKIPSKWKVEVNEQIEALHPWNACLYSDLVPIIVTEDLKTSKWFPQIERFILQDLFDNQSRNPIIKKNKLGLWVFIDELESMLKYGPFLQSFASINKQARFQRMGIVYATQYVGNIPGDIWIATDYVVSFQQTADEAKYICDNYEVMKSEQKALTRLPTFHCMIGGENFVVYHPDGKREVIETQQTFTGRIFPSVSQHSAPKKVGV